jgi:H+/Cl- antiporter ClcA
MPTSSFHILWLVWALAVLAGLLGAVTSFLVIESMALHDPERGDTLTETVRMVLSHPFSPAWILLAIFFVAVVGVVGWAAPHLLGMGKLW